MRWLVLLIAACGGTDATNAPTQPDVCAHYVSCVAATEPTIAAMTLAAYGSQGTCWSAQANADVVSTCTTACTVGLMELSTQNAACGCRNDGDCSGATPTCMTSGVCVACTSDATCGAGHCGSDHTCHACTLGNQCTSHRCDENGTCCVPSTNACQGAQCGAADDGCGNQIACGTCTKGVCSGFQCTTSGDACTPETAVTDCVSGEWCFFDENSGNNVCASKIPTNATTCGSSADCNGTNATLSVFSCNVGTCERNCLESASCAAGVTCHEVNGPISTTHPGLCY